MDRGLYEPTDVVPIRDTAPSEVEPPETVLKPCGCDPALDETCAVCFRQVVAVQEIPQFMEREHEVTGCDPKGSHYDSGKPRLDLLDSYAMEQMGRVLAFGAEKYDPWNWTRGIGHTRLVASALRHIFAWMRREDADPESGLPHLAHAMCCLMMLLGMTQRHPNLDDRCEVA